MEYDAQPMFLESTQLLNANAGLFNIFGSTDPQLTQLLATARAQTSKAALPTAWAAVERRVVELGGDRQLRARAAGELGARCHDAGRGAAAGDCGA